MNDINNWVWIIDRGEMCCRNLENNVIVKMEKEGGNIRGKLHDMPMALYGKIAGIKNGEKIIRQIVKAAEKEYFRACFYE